LDRSRVRRLLRRARWPPAARFLRSRESGIGRRMPPRGGCRPPCRREKTTASPLIPLAGATVGAPRPLRSRTARIGTRLGRLPGPPDDDRRGRPRTPTGSVGRRDARAERRRSTSSVTAHALSSAGSHGAGTARPWRAPRAAEGAARLTAVRQGRPHAPGGDGSTECPLGEIRADLPIPRGPGDARLHPSAERLPRERERLPVRRAARPAAPPPRRRSPRRRMRPTTGGAGDSL